jgi:hypothetical protein
MVKKIYIIKPRALHTHVTNPLSTAELDTSIRKRNEGGRGGPTKKKKKKSSKN